MLIIKEFIKVANMPENNQNEQIDAFLSLFDNNAALAISAIQSRGQNTVITVNNVNKPKVENSGKEIISVDSLTKTYKIGKQKIQALNNVSTKIYEGEIIAITGASGSGKSTLLQIIGGLDKPTSGTVIVSGDKISHMSDRKLSNFRNRTIGFVFQFFYLQPFLKLEKNLEVAGMPMRTKHKRRLESVVKLAEATGLSERLKHYPKELSGGQLQRAAIARALLNNPKIILADEPTGNLDSKNGQSIIELFEQIRRDFNTTIIIVTHDPIVAGRADRIITLRDGQII